MIPEAITDQRDEAQELTNEAIDKHTETKLHEQKSKTFKIPLISKKMNPI